MTVDEVEQGSPASPPQGKKRPLRVVALNVLFIALGLCVVEGGASLLLFTNQIMDATPREEGGFTHTDYDPLLGWISRPNIRAEDYFGPGLDLTTNARRARGVGEISDAPAEGMRRVICAGDSFTLAVGVGDDATWCHLLAQSVPSLETVNMGQAGYGLDQTYLLYGRDVDFEHDLLLFTIIGNDFRRMWGERFQDYDKPMLAIAGDSVAPTNVPVPTTSFDRRGQPDRGRALATAISELGTTRVLRLIAGRFGSKEAEGGGLPRGRATPERRDILLRMFATLTRTAQGRGAEIAVAYLPEVDDCEGEYDHWKAIVAEAASSGSWPFWDLTEAFCSQPFTAQSQLVIPQGSGRGRSATGHYNELGNRFVVDRLAPLVAEALDGSVDPS